MSSTDTGAEVIRYVGYDTRTGQIVHTHAQFSVPENRYVEVPADQLKARFSADPGIVDRLTDGDAGNLDFIKAESRGATGLAHGRHDQPQPCHAAAAGAGGGPDGAGRRRPGQRSARRHRGRRGRAGHRGAGGTVKVETTRGKLSARGGVVELAAGRGTVTLTSANETVSQVRVRASGVGQPYAPAQLDLEFA